MTQTFRINDPLRLLTPLLLTCVFTLGILLVVSEPDTRWTVWIVGAVLLVSVAIAAWLMTRTKLEISSDGVTYYGIGYKVASTWANVSGYGKRVMGAQDIESLILREPGIEMARWMQIGYKLMPAASLVSLLDGDSRVFVPRSLSNYADAIPVGMFDKDWQQGEIGALVKRYAPEAFETAAR
jgi:hypothetical protein